MRKEQKTRQFLLIAAAFVFCNVLAFASDKDSSSEKETKAQEKEFSWWPTDAKPVPVKDENRGGYWWWPNQPGKEGPLWGNRGYVYVYKVIFDYKEEELPAPKEQELRPSLLIKKIIKNVKIYFDYNKADIRQDAKTILEDAIKALGKNPQADILITGNCDIRGSEAYNEKLGKRRAEVVKQYMLDNGIEGDRIRIVSRGKLDAVSPVTDLFGMQKDRNAQFMVAEVEEVMIPYEGRGDKIPAEPQGKKIVLTDDNVSSPEASVIEEKEETVESEVKVSTEEYTIKKGDSLWKIAEKELGSGHRWKYLYELNKDRIKNPNKLKAGKKIIIPIE